MSVDLDNISFIKRIGGRIANGFVHLLEYRNICVAVFCSVSFNLIIVNDTLLLVQLDPPTEHQSDIQEWTEIVCLFYSLLINPI